MFAANFRAASVHIPAHRPLLPLQKVVNLRVHQRMFEGGRSGADETAHVLDLGQRLLVRDHSREQVPDLAQRLVITVLSDPEQVPNLLPHPRLRVRGALVPTTATWTTPTAAVRGQLPIPSGDRRGRQVRAPRESGDARAGHQVATISRIRAFHGHPHLPLWGRSPTAWRCHW
ncbi:hypothetical protein [Amycolatopsis sp. NPDC058986]